MERKDFSCTPETGTFSAKAHQAEVSASFEATPEPARMTAKPVKPAAARAVEAIADVAREIIGGIQKRGR